MAQRVLPVDEQAELLARFQAMDLAAGLDPAQTAARIDGLAAQLFSCA